MIDILNIAKHAVLIHKQEKGRLSFYKSAIKVLNAEGHTELTVKQVRDILAEMRRMIEPRSSKPVS